MVSADDGGEIEHVSLATWIKKDILRRGTFDQVLKASLALATIALNYYSDD